MSTPVFFLTNPEDTDLPAISDELNRIVLFLEASNLQDSINIQWRPNISIDTFSSVVRNYKHRLVLFHFAGHANSKELIFSDHSAQADALADFFEEQPYLFLVVLNGCSTSDQVERLLEKGIPAVIATVKAVPDEEAATFAEIFYKEWISQDQTLKDAFQTGINHLGLTNIGLEAKVVKTRDRKSKLAIKIPSWSLYLNEEFPWAEHSKVKDILSNPLIGVAPIQKNQDSLSLGKPHFKGLAPFTDSDAHIFFGRNQEIKDLYNFVNKDGTETILLLYGQSGVGKSSLLLAGLIPRLPNEYRVEIIRNHYSASLSSIFTTHSDLDLLILDQFETVLLLYPQELQKILLKIQKLSHKGCKIILSFRKEYLAEISKNLGKNGLPYTNQFVEALTNIQVQEIVQNMDRLPLASRDYYFEHPALLGQHIAANLRDPNSSLAPTFQLLLSVMYEEAITGDQDRKKIDLALYDRIGKRGKHLYDFVGYELKKLEKHEDKLLSEAGHSGLALDILYLLTDSVNLVAKEIDLKDLLQKYPHVKNLSLLLAYLENRYLILSGAKDLIINNKKQQVKYIRLAHDTLAKEIGTLFYESDRPGQKITRIVASKIREGNSLLNKGEIKLLKKGKNGRRVLSSEEELLNSDSKTKQRKTVKRQILGLGVLLILLGSLSFWWWWVQAPKILKLEITNLEKDIKDGNWHDVRMAYHTLADKKPIREHFLATLIHSPRHGSANQIKNLSSVLSKFPKSEANTRHAKAVAAFWLSYSSYWKTGDTLLQFIDDEFSKSQLFVREKALMNMGNEQRAAIKDYFPSFVPILVESESIDTCELRSLQSFQMSAYELTLKQYVIHLNLAERFSGNDRRDLKTNQQFVWNEENKFWRIDSSDQDLPVELRVQYAIDYCMWAAYHLPTIKEWEWAARSILSRPITDQLLDSLQEVIDDEKSIVGNSIPYENGLYDLLGNLSEYVVDCDRSVFGDAVHTVRGGAYNLLNIGELIYSLSDKQSPLTQTANRGRGLRPVKIIQP